MKINAKRPYIPMASDYCFMKILSKGTYKSRFRAIRISGMT